MSGFDQTKIARKRYVAISSVATRDGPSRCWIPLNVFGHGLDALDAALSPACSAGQRQWLARSLTPSIRSQAGCGAHNCLTHAAVVNRSGRHAWTDAASSHCCGSRHTECGGFCCDQPTFPGRTHRGSYSADRSSQHILHFCKRHTPEGATPHFVHRMLHTTKADDEK